MTEKKGRGSRRSDRPEQVVAAELKEKRDAFLQTFFKRGAELTDELVSENGRLREKMGKLEAENAALKTQLASDSAIRECLKKIDELEREKARLLSTVHEQEEIDATASPRSRRSSRASRTSTWRASSFTPRSGCAPSCATSRSSSSSSWASSRWASTSSTTPTGGCFPSRPTASSWRRSRPSASKRAGAGAGRSIRCVAVVERTYLTGVPHIAEGEKLASPQACIPLLFEDRAVGVIVVYYAARAEEALRHGRPRALQAARRARRRRPRGRPLLGLVGRPAPERPGPARRVCVGICRERRRQPITRKTLSPR